ncbi:MAG: hypothetical protein UU36_C0005G0002 [Candidatus Uhrbacteria bacterium GW2011_GWE2_41_1153]|nr:MAG: hypothetical protein UU36_C0005G0002 [Candidatus Uhrbacteria bacterium GW2011_GWE2_41_1153]
MITPKNEDDEGDVDWVGATGAGCGDICGVGVATGVGVKAGAGISDAGAGPLVAADLVLAFDHQT